MAVSLERVFPGRGEAVFPARPGYGPSSKNASFVPVLGRISVDVLHVFLYPGVLFDALLSGSGAACRPSHRLWSPFPCTARNTGDRKRSPVPLDQMGQPRANGNRLPGGADHNLDTHSSLESPRTRRHL